MAVAEDAASPVAEMCHRRRPERLVLTDKSLWNTRIGANAKSGARLARSAPQRANPMASRSVPSMANDAAWEASVGRNFMLV